MCPSADRRTRRWDPARGLQRTSRHRHRRSQPLQDVDRLQVSGARSAAGARRPVPRREPLRHRSALRSAPNNTATAAAWSMRQTHRGSAGPRASPAQVQAQAQVYHDAPPGDLTPNCRGAGRRHHGRSAALTPGTTMLLTWRPGRQQSQWLFGPNGGWNRLLCLQPHKLVVGLQRAYMAAESFVSLPLPLRCAVPRAPAGAHCSCSPSFDAYIRGTLQLIITSMSMGGLCRGG